MHKTAAVLVINAHLQMKPNMIEIENESSQPLLVQQQKGRQ